MDRINVNTKDIEKLYDSKYFKISKKLQLFVGLWPYHVDFKRKVQRCIVYLTLIISTLPLVNGARVWCGKDLALCCENSLWIWYMFVVFFKYAVTIICESKMKKLHEKMTINWLTLTDSEEKAIMTEYARKGRLKAIAYFWAMIVAGISVSQMPLVPVILDLINPLNVSRDKVLVVEAEYVIFDPYELYYILYVLTTGVAVVSALTFISVDVNLTIIANQTLAIFSIVSRRLKLISFDPNSKSESDYYKIVQAIVLHKDALQFVELLESTYSAFFLILVAYSIAIPITCSVMTISSISQKNYSSTPKTIMVMIGGVMHMFYVSWPGQMLIDHSSDVFSSIYDNEWYNISHRGKVLLNILMLRCIKPCNLTAKGLYVMNFENFGNILKSGVTYMTVAVSFLN